MRTNSGSPERRNQLRLPGPELDAALIAALRAQVSSLAELTVASVAAQVPQYAAALEGAYRRALEDGVRMAYDNFVDLLAPAGPETEDLAEGALSRARRGADALGRGEARAGRSIEALLSAYRVGAGIHWQELSRVSLARGISAAGVADLAALILAYNHELSAASVAGHEDEIAALRRRRERRLEALARALLVGEPAEQVRARAENATWTVPQTLTVVLLPARRADPLIAEFPGTLVLSGGPPELPDEGDLTVMLVPDTHHRRKALLHALAGVPAVAGPARPWTQARVSYLRAVRALALPHRTSARPVDTEQHLAELLLSADLEALNDLRAQVLAPLADLPAATAVRLADTLRSWLLHSGRRDDVAADLHVHPQTVRYRMGQIRDRFGPSLSDPDHVLRLVLALAAPGPRA
jgi:hypothetical protein